MGANRMMDNTRKKIQVGSVIKGPFALNSIVARCIFLVFLRI